MTSSLLSCDQWLPWRSTHTDVWSAAELLLGQPIFLGDIEVDQLVEIIKILGILNTAAQNLLQNTKIFTTKC